jgi:hypothetical protein
MTFGIVSATRSSACEAFEPAHGFVNTSIHQQNCFVEMRFLHLNRLHCLRPERRSPIVDGSVEAHG